MEIVPVHYGTTRGRMALYAFGAAAFMAMGVWLVLGYFGDLWDRFLGSVVVAASALSFIVFLSEIVRPRIGLRLDVDGIHSRQALRGNGFDLPWSQFAGVRLVMVRRSPMVIFDPVDADWELVDAKPAIRAMRQVDRGLVGSWMSLPTQPFGIEPEALIAEVDRYLRPMPKYGRKNPLQRL